MAIKYIYLNNPDGTPSGRCKKVSGYLDSENVWHTDYVYYNSGDCPPTLRRPTSSTNIRKMEMLGTEVDTNTILKWVAIIAVVVLAGWYIMKKMR